MVDAIAPTQPTTGPFDTAAMQIAQARAQAAVDHVNEDAFLKEIAKTNDETNAHALDDAPSAVPVDPLATPLVLTGDPSVDTALDPAFDQATLSLFSQIGNDPANATTDSIKAQQLHDLAVLQKDAELLEEAANENNPLPLGNAASTVDLSAQAQGIVDASQTAALNGPPPLTSAQLTQIGDILQPAAGEPLTPSLLQQLQTQLDAAMQHPIQLNLNTINLALNYIAAQQPSTSHTVENTVTQVDNKRVAPITPIDAVAVEDSAIR